MSAELIAVTGMGVGTDPDVVEATIVIPPGNASKVLAEGKNAYLNGVVGQVTNITVPSAGATEPDPGPYDAVFVATTVKGFSAGLALLREGDVSQPITAAPGIPGEESEPYPVTFVLVINDANQTKALLV